MCTPSPQIATLPPEQQAIRDKCFHPLGTFSEFTEKDVEQSIPARFEQKVREYSQHIAIKSLHFEATYAELDNAANRIAHAILSRRGEEPEPVALLFEHGAQVAMAILGSLKANKFYVALDASHPVARISYILENSRSGLVLTNNRNLSLAKVIAGDSHQIINIEAIRGSTPNESPGLPIVSGSLASIIYTSGSTGEPKGVAHLHRTLLHLAMSHTNMFHICPEDRQGLFFPSPQLVEFGTFCPRCLTVRPSTLLT